MAPLPENTEYQTGTKLKFPKPGDLIRGAAGVSLTPVQPSATQPNVLGAYSRPGKESAVTELTQAISSGKTGFGIQKPIGAPAASKISAPPAGYSPYLGPATGGTNASGKQPINPAIHQMPGDMGQYNIDLTDPTKLVKSSRAEGSNQLILGPLSNKMFQVDHIVPLWVGGADSLANKQTLPKSVHSAKTKIQAVAQSLLFAGKISREEAFVLANNWQSRSATGIPEINNENPFLDTATAEKFYEQWKHDDKYGKKQTLKDVLAAVPEAANNFGKDMGLPEWARQLVIGTASGLTAGAVPLNSSADATAVDKIAGLAGNVVGTVVGVGKFAKLASFAGKGVASVFGKQAANLGGKMGIAAARGRVIENGLGGVSAFAPKAGAAVKEAVAPAAVKGIKGILGKKVKESPQAIMDSLKAFNVKAALGKAAENSVGFGLYGQAGQTLADFTMPQENALKAHVDRLRDDLLLGGLTGALPGTWKGTSGVVAGTLSLGLMSGDSPREALSEALAVGALHRVGGFAQDLTKAKIQHQAQVDENATKGAFNVLHTFVGDAPIKIKMDGPAVRETSAPGVSTEAADLLSKIDSGSGAPAFITQNLRKIATENQVEITKTMTANDVIAALRSKVGTNQPTASWTMSGGEIRGVPRPDISAPAPSISSYTNEELTAWSKKAFETIENTPGLSDAAKAGAQARAAAAVKWLQNRKLSEDAAEQAAVADLISVSRVLKNKTDIDGIATPNYLPTFATKFAADAKKLLDERPARMFENGRWVYQRPRVDGEGLPEFNGLRGDVRLTGQAASGSNEDTMKDFIRKLDSGEASPVVFIVRQPEYAPLLRDNNRTITEDMIKSGEHFLDKHPENLLNVYGMVKGADGEYQLTQLGARVPSRERIGVVKKDKDGNDVVEGYKYAFNKDPEAKKFGYDNANFNKDTLGMALSARNMSIIPARVSVYSDAALKSGKPYTIVHVGDQEWQLAKKINDDLGGPVEHNSYRENIAQAFADRERKNVEPLLTKAAEQLADEGETALTVARAIPSRGTNIERNDALDEFTEKATEAMQVSNTPEQMAMEFKQKLDIDLLPEEAIQMVETKTAMTAGNLMKTVDRAIEEGRVGPLSAASYDVYVKPFTNTRTFKNSEAGLLFDKMPLMKREAPNGASLLEAKPILAAEKTGNVPPELAEATEALHSIGVANRADDLSLDTYVDELIANINASPVDEKGKQALAQEAFKLLDTSELKSRGVSIAKMQDEFDNVDRKSLDSLAPNSEAARRSKAYRAYERAAGEKTPLDNLDEMRERIADTFGVEPGMRPFKTTKMDADEAEAIAEKAIVEDVAPYFAKIKEGVKGDPTTYVTSHDEVFDTLAKEFWGKDYDKNVNLMSIMTDKSEHGKQLFHSVRQTPRGPKDPLFATEDFTGRQISQPNILVEKWGRGERNTAGTDAAVASRKRELEDGNQGAPKERMTDEEADVFESGGRMVDERQDPSKNVQDLTNYEAERLPGLLDEELNGPDPKLSPIRGAEDATTEILNMVSAYNKAIDAGFITGKKVGSSKAKTIVAATKEKMAKRSENKVKKNELLEKAKVELAELTTANDNMASLGGTKVQSYAQKEMESNNERIKKLQDFIDKYGEKPAVAADAQGGPGFDPVAAPKAADNLDTLVMPNPVVGAVTPPAPEKKGIFPAKQPGQSTIDYLTGTTRIDNSPKSKYPTLQGLDLATPQKQVNDANVALNQTKTSIFSKLAQNVATAAQKAADKVTGTTRYQRTPSSGQAPTSGAGGNPVVMGYDIGRYATDPTHETKVANIASKLTHLATSTDIDGYIKSRFPQSPVTGTMVAAASNKHGVPPAMVLAIMQQDSSIGTAGLGARTNNPGNVGNDDDGNIRKYPSWAAGVDAVAAWLAKNRAS